PNPGNKLKQTNEQDGSCQDPYQIIGIALKKGDILMLGNPKLIETLNALLADELAAINQYIVHAEMCEDWGYGKLHEGFEKRSIEEMKHAEQLIGRILFLGGTPVVTKLSNIKIGKDVPKQVEYDRAAEESAIKAYND